MNKKVEEIRLHAAKLASLVDGNDSPLAERAKALLREAVQKLEQVFTAN